MSRFEIFQIGEDVEPAAGIPEGCEICGHCRMLRGTLPVGTSLPCGAATPHGARRESRPQPLQSPEQTLRGAS